MLLREEPLQPQEDLNSKKTNQPSQLDSLLKKARFKLVNDKNTGSNKHLLGSVEYNYTRNRIIKGLAAIWKNKRLRWGLLLIVIVAPFVKFAYLLFPDHGFGEYLINTSFLQIPNTIEGRDSGWYWFTINMYLFSNGELLAPAITLAGVFFLFPKNYYPAYIMGIPFGYYCGLSIYRLFIVKSYENFHDSWSIGITLLFGSLGVVAFVLSDKVLFKDSDTRRLHESRILGLIDMPNVPWEEKEELVRNEVRELRKIDNEFFIKKPVKPIK